MIDLDARVLLALHGDGQGAWGTLMIAATLLGEGWTALLLVPLLARPRTRRFARVLTVTVLSQAVLVWGLKLLVGRVRPWIALGLAPVFGAPHDGSFPSGHAAGSFCVAAFLAVALPVAWSRVRAGAWAVVALSFVVAGLIATSRVYLAAHYPSDVLAGALLGSVVGAIGGRRHAAAVRDASPEADRSASAGPRWTNPAPAVGVEDTAKRG